MGKREGEEEVGDRSLDQKQNIYQVHSNVDCKQAYCLNNTNSVEVEWYTVCCIVLTGLSNIEHGHVMLAHRFLLPSDHIRPHNVTKQTSFFTFCSFPLLRKNLKNLKCVSNTCIQFKHARANTVSEAVRPGRARSPLTVSKKISRRDMACRDGVQSELKD